MALAVLLKCIATMTMALILTKFSGAAPFTIATTPEPKRNVADTYTETTTITTSTVTDNVTAPTVFTEIITSSYTAAHIPPSLCPAYHHSIFTLTDTSDEDLPSAISLDHGVKVAPLATLHYTTKAASVPIAKKLFPRITVGPRDGPMTTMEGVSTSVYFLSYTRTITRPAPTSTQTTEASLKTTSSSSIESTTSITSTSENPTATSTSTRNNESKETLKPAYVAAILIPSVFAACWVFICVVFWQLQRDRLPADIEDDVETDSASSTPLSIPSFPAPPKTVYSNEIYAQEVPDELRGDLAEYREREKDRVAELIAALEEEQKRQGG